MLFARREDVPRGAKNFRNLSMRTSIALRYPYASAPLIDLISNALHTRDMRSVEENRRANLALLQDELGNLQRVADLTGINKTQLSQWKNASPDSKTGKPRNMSSPSARRTEKALGKQPYWMDQEHYAQSGAGPDDDRYKYPPTSPLTALPVEIQEWAGEALDDLTSSEISELITLYLTSGPAARARILADARQTRAIASEAISPKTARDNMKKIRDAQHADNGEDS